MKTIKLLFFCLFFVSFAAYSQVDSSPITNSSKFESFQDAKTQNDKEIIQLRSNRDKGRRFGPKHNPSDIEKEDISRTATGIHFLFNIVKKFFIFR